MPDTNWSKLNKLQLGRYAEYYAKMEFASYGFEVYTSEVDDHGIDFIAKEKNGKKKKNSLQIRNSTAEFLIFTSQANENTIEVRVENETVWLTQKLIAELFGVEVNTINYHLKEIFKSEELSEEAVIRKIRITASDGKSYNTNFYNLDAIISVGYRVNSVRATQFRQWATGVLRNYAIRGYVLDKD